MTSQDDVTVCSTQDGLAAVSQHADSCPDIFGAPVTQHLIFIHEEISKQHRILIHEEISTEVVIRGLYRLKDTTEKPISGYTQFVCRLDIVK